MADTNPIEIPSGPIPTVSKRSIPIAGLHVDVYGLDELLCPPNDGSGGGGGNAAPLPVSCLWLEHPRLQTREKMADTAHLVLSAYHHRQQQQPGRSGRGLIAVAFDQRNHGSRLVDPLANDSWKKGNPAHAQDMFACVSGTAGDTSHLMDVVEAYVFNNGDGNGKDEEGAKDEKRRRSSRRRKIDQHLALGVSLGGHVVWHLMFREPRLTAGVVVIGCPDYMWLMRDRARRSKLDSYSAADPDAFYGGPHFPDALVATCEAYDPKGILFGLAGAIPEPTPEAGEEQARLRGVLDSRIRGKRFQVLSGGADKLVPYVASERFMRFFKDAVAGWYKDGGVFVQDNVYEGVGHEFNAAMGKDALKFLLESVALHDEKVGRQSSSSPKI